MVASDAGLTLVDHVYAKLVELGVDERWLLETNPTSKAALDLLKGIIYLKEMYQDALEE